MDHNPDTPREIVALGYIFLLLNLGIFGVTLKSDFIEHGDMKRDLRICSGGRASEENIK